MSAGVVHLTLPSPTRTGGKLPKLNEYEDYNWYLQLYPQPYYGYAILIHEKDAGAWHPRREFLFRKRAQREFEAMVMRVREGRRP